jgi:hypothetical protein
MYNSDQDCAASIVQATLSKFDLQVGNKFNQQSVECVCTIRCVLLLAYIKSDLVILALMMILHLFYRYKYFIQKV